MLVFMSDEGACDCPGKRKTKDDCCSSSLALAWPVKAAGAVIRAISSQIPLLPELDSDIVWSLFLFNVYAQVLAQGQAARSARSGYEAWGCEIPFGASDITWTITRSGEEQGPPNPSFSLDRPSSSQSPFFILAKVHARRHRPVLSACRSYQHPSD